MDDVTTRIAVIAAAARTLQERLAVCRVGGDEVDDGVVDTVRAAWCRASAVDDPAYLDRRLAWDGIDDVVLRRVIANVGAPVDGTTGWPATFAALIGSSAEPIVVPADGPHAATIAAIGDLPADAARDAAAPLPFEEVWLPFVGPARSRLLARLAADDAPVSGTIAIEPRAHAALERDLLSRLSDIGADALLRAFDRVRPRDAVLRGRLFGTATAGKGGYDAFVAGLRGHGLLDFFEDFPVAARLMTEVIDDWVDATAEFFARLNADADVIAATFAIAAPCRIVAIEAGLSDPHRGGRRVAVLRFADGRALVYKPKPFSTEAAFNRFLGWFGDAVPDLRQKVPACVDGGDYGWMEHVAALPCRDAAEETLFYENAGVLLCLLHLLGVNDGHLENLIACGPHPVFVDGETVMHPEPAVFDPGFAWVRRAAFDRSVVATGLLPRWMVDAENRMVVDITALGGGAEGQTALSTRVWNGLGTDAVHRATTDRSAATASRPEPTSGLSADDHGRAMARGFASAYGALLERRDALLAADGPIAAFTGLEVRFIYRATAIYAAMLERSVTANALTDGLSRSILLDAVTRVHLDGTEPTAEWEIAKVEIAALERLDVPVFLVPCSGDALPLGTGAAIAGFMQAPALERVRERIAAMGEADLSLQTAIIRGSFAARAARTVAVTAETAGRDDLDLSESPLDRDELLDEALAIADDIAALAHADRDGRIHWLGLREIEGTGRHQLAPLDDALHAGSVGIGLFFAACARASGDAAQADRALASVARVRRRLGDPGEAPSLVADGAIGGGLGFGSILYGLARIADLLDDAALGREAAAAAALITDARIAEDEGLDVMTGSAGAILGLLAVERRAGDGRALERAVACGRRLLDRREGTGEGPRGWRGRNRRALTGFSHGAAGISHALERLFEATGIDDFRRAADEGVAFENRLFRPDLGNWPDLRDGAGTPDTPAFANGWCNGAPGIALSRLGSTRLRGDPIVCAEVDAALDTTCACGAEGLDHLCCGAMGRVETLWVAATELDRAELGRRAGRLAARVVRRARRDGGYRFSGLIPGDLNPGLFTGTAGIGYQLLRLRDPELIPSVLSWS